ncbi:mitochondrial inner membrane protein OXA1L-like [Saccoglossus kowalevskii]|uniref:Mitochondrial inner membrane protein OXA1L-like n=1 Tax=Saccoglossus kowalevskii TaxID=10224 RepID=A0ABM0MAV6_SACKO|nr:PREDICTED: mitochondrial inner membrane protein OXA1L-like [Saccoglossus kowalevskii]
MAALITWRGPTCFSRCLVKRAQAKIILRNQHSWRTHHVLIHGNNNKYSLCTKLTRHHWKILSTTSVIRHNSSTTHTQTQPVADVTEKLSQIDPSSTVVAQSVTPEVTEIVQKVQEVPFSELGLGNFTPVGAIQNCLEFLHINLHLPWWSAIVVGTVIARFLIFPVVIRGQRNAVKLNNVMPTVQRLTNKMNEIRSSGSQLEIARATNELQMFMKKHGVNPMKNMLVPLVQAPIFISFFIGLRKMAALPVESMQTGGLYWFTDLTIADPYYIMPAIATLSMLCIIELGGETGVQNPQMQNMKTVMRILPFVILPFTASMPASVFCYWLTSNFISLGQVALLKNPNVRAYFNIPERIVHAPGETTKPEGFVKNLKSGWKNAQMQQEIEQREKFLERGFKQAGTGAIPQTFDYDPTQARPGSQQTSTKQKVRAVRKKVT